MKEITHDLIHAFNILLHTQSIVMYATVNEYLGYITLVAYLKLFFCETLFKDESTKDRLVTKKYSAEPNF